jgi:hypothetical protein
MFFFFKSSTIDIDCFTPDEIVFHNFRPDRANKFVPEEWKKLPADLILKANHNPKSKLTVQHHTLKKCVGFTDLYTQGFIIPSWADFQLEMMEDGRHSIANHTTSEVNGMFDQHQRNQFGDEIYPNCGHIKLVSKWWFKEKTSVKFTWNSCAWSNTSELENFYILPGVVDFKYQSGTHINAFQRKGTIVKFNGGDPLVHLIPISDKKIKLHYHHLDMKEYNDMMEREKVSLMFKKPREVKAKCPF